MIEINLIAAPADQKGTIVLPSKSYPSLNDTSVGTNSRFSWIVICANAIIDL